MPTNNIPQPEKKPTLPESAQAPEIIQRPVLELEKTEAIAETPRETELQATEESKVAPAPAPSLVTPPPPTPSAKPEQLIGVEKIMSDGLEKVFVEMSPEEQQKFKIKGEETAIKIWQTLQSAKIQVQKIIDLIRGWLKMVPGINRYFLEQETKIKTDKIIELIKK
ncbi:MAG: hypothetical protein AAB568_04060 [Patescibacteria group bacterium]